MPEQEPITDDLLAAVLTHGKLVGGRNTKVNVEADKPRTLSEWIKLKSRFIQEIPNLPHLSNARCSNPNCTYAINRERGAIASVNGLDMRRVCFIEGYGTPLQTTPQTNPSQTQLKV